MRSARQSEPDQMPIGRLQNKEQYREGEAINRGRARYRERAVEREGNNKCSGWVC